MLVTRRRVMYVPGYDPRGLPEYYRMFRTELRRFCSLHDVRATLSRVESPPGRHASLWTIQTAGGGWNVETTYEFLRWEDIIRSDFARPAWWKVLHAFKTFGQILIDGTFARMTRAHWRFGCFYAFPFVFFLLSALISGLLGWAASWLTAAILPVFLVPAAVGLLVAIAALVAIVRLTEPHSMVLYLFDDAISTRDFANRQRPDWEERLQTFATYLVESASKNDVDEIVIVGHSSGSFLAVDLLARALALDPKLGLHGPRIALLTVGANLPVVGFNPKAHWFRDHLRRLGNETTVDWVEYQSRKDVMNFCAFDPIAGHGIDAGSGRVNPTIVQVRFRDIISPETYRRFRWRFFRVHFQFVRANERPAHYDYFMMVCGPLGLKYRAEHPDEASSLVGNRDSEQRAAGQA